jgi:hypothetical protein
MSAGSNLTRRARHAVLAPAPGVIGALMAVEVLKDLSGIDVHRGAMRLDDGTTGDFRLAGISKDRDGTTCGRPT